MPGVSRPNTRLGGALDVILSLKAGLGGDTMRRRPALEVGFGWLIQIMLCVLAVVTGVSAIVALTAVVGVS